MEPRCRPLPPCAACCRLNFDVTLTSTVPSMTPAEPVAAVPTDAALIAAWRGGDEPAAAELVRRHARALARFLAGAGALAADVDDLVQETFIRAFRALGRFRGQCQFRTWLMTIGGNVLKDAHRRAPRGGGGPRRGAPRAPGGDPPPPGVPGAWGLARRSGSTSSARRRPWSHACGRSRVPRFASWDGYSRRGYGSRRCSCCWSARGSWRSMYGARSSRRPPSCHLHPRGAS